MVNIASIVIIVTLVVVIIVLIILLALKVSCKECLPCEECEICEGNGECPEIPECPEGPCIINDVTNNPFQYKKIRLATGGYLAISNDNTLTAKTDDINTDYWTYENGSLISTRTGLAIRCVVTDGSYNFHTFIQLYQHENIEIEKWDFDGYNFYFRPLSSGTTKYVLTPVVPNKINNEVVTSTYFTIVPVTNYAVGRNMDNQQPLIVEF